MVPLRERNGAPMMTWCDPEWNDPAAAMGEPTWKKRGCGTTLAVAVLVSCVLWAAVLVPLILWWPW
jgi:hypothetical protein